MPFGVGSQFSGTGCSKQSVDILIQIKKICTRSRSLMARRFLRKRPREIREVNWSSQTSVSCNGRMHLIKIVSSDRRRFADLRGDSLSLPSQLRRFRHSQLLPFRLTRLTQLQNKLLISGTARQYQNLAVLGADDGAASGVVVGGEIGVRTVDPRRRRCRGRILQRCTAAETKGCVQLVFGHIWHSLSEGWVWIGT